MTRSTGSSPGRVAVAVLALVVAAGCRRPSACPEGYDQQPGKLPNSVWCQQRGGNKALLIQLYPDTGRRRQTCAYVDGVPEGPVEGWHPSGKPWLSGRYLAGKPEGEWTQMDEQGVRQVAVGEYRNGRVVRGAPVAAWALCASGKP